MPMSKEQKKAAEYAALITKDVSAFMTIAVQRLSQPFDDDELRCLANAGYETITGEYSARKGEDVITKVQVELGVYVFVKLGPSHPAAAAPKLNRLVRPKHVEEFLAELGESVPGSCPEKWGVTGSKGLLYRGFNVFEIYVRKEFNELMTNIIKNDDEVRTNDAKCDGREGCVQFLEKKREEGCDVRVMIEAARKCCETNAIDPENITCQEVYLGYCPNQDMFVTAWDVFGSEGTGCVIIAFRINERGEVCEFNMNGESTGADPCEIYDASNLKFYQKPDASAQQRGPHRGSMYENVSQSKHGDWTLIDIRLD